MIRSMKHLALLAALAVPAALTAQDRWSVDVGAGAAFATQDLGDADLSTGVVFEGTLAYRLMPHLWVYGGWDWLHFQATNSFAGADVDFEETGYAYGLRFEHPLRAGSDAAFRLRAGGTYDHIEVESADGAVSVDSGHGIGWEVGAGLAVPLSDTWRLVPGVRYRALSRDIGVGAVTTEVDLTYVTIDLGVSRTF